jgi:hypothetical protein
MKKLPVYKGWTVDFRLKQFRFVDDIGKGVALVDFDTDLGMDLLIQIAKEHLTNDL